MTPLVYTVPRGTTQIDDVSTWLSPSLHTPWRNVFFEYINHIICLRSLRSLSLKMGYRILTNRGMGPYIQQQGLCTAFTVASLGDLGGFSSCIGRALGEIIARKPLIHGTGKCMRALRWQYPYFGLRLRVIDMGLATKYLIMVI